MKLRLTILSLVVSLGAMSACSSDETATPHAKGAAALVDAGLAAHVDNDTVQARKDYLAALAQDPQNKYALYNLGLLAQRAGDEPEAERRYRAVLEVDETYHPALFNLAILRTETAPDEAVALYRRAVAAKPDDAGSHLNLGFLLRKLGNTVEGDAEIATAESLKPAPAEPAAPESDEPDDDDDDGTTTSAQP